MKKAAGEEKEEDIQMTQGIQKLVTADGTYASQSAFSAMLPVKKDQARLIVFTAAVGVCFLKTRESSSAVVQKNRMEKVVCII